MIQGANLGGPAGLRGFEVQQALRRAGRVPLEDVLHELGVILHADEHGRKVTEDVAPERAIRGLRVEARGRRDGHLPVLAGHELLDPGDDLEKLLIMPRFGRDEHSCDARDAHEAGAVRAPRGCQFLGHQFHHLLPREGAGEGYPLEGNPRVEVMLDG